MTKASGGRIYDTAKWKQLRHLYFQRHPLCVDCQLMGRATAATHLDHIKPVAEAPELAWTWSNLQGLCHQHHSEKTATADRGFGRAPGQRKIKGCTVTGMPLDPGHPWNAGRER